jgi:hypothetical protein
MPQSPFVMQPSILNGGLLVSLGADAGCGVPDEADCTGLVMLLYLTLEYNGSQFLVGHYGSSHNGLTLKQ